MTIDSLQASYGGLHGPGSPPTALANNNCAEPVNFAFLTYSGRPVGPPGPDKQSNKTFTPTKDTLLNPGDTLTVSMHDTSDGYYTQITDNTTGESGSMTASIANSFRHIICDPVKFTSKGKPYAFHAMYDRAMPPTARGSPPRGRRGRPTPTTSRTTSKRAISSRPTRRATRVSRTLSRTRRASQARSFRVASLVAGTRTSTGTRTRRPIGRADPRIRPRPTT